VTRCGGGFESWGNYETPRVYRIDRRRGGLAARGARAAAGDAGSWLPQQFVTERADFRYARIPPDWNWRASWSPRGTTLATLVNPDNPPSVTEGTTLQEAAATLGQPIQILNASTEGHIDDAFAAIVQQRIGALIVSSDPLFFIERKKLVVLTARHALPTIFADREQAEAGGLISYGANRPEAYRQAGTYVGRVVKGERPGDLPVVLPTKFDLLINLKTAKALGLEIPPTVLARADEVIE
jgi:ABC-type uncharacterized transport system substrate-binding protein